MTARDLQLQVRLDARLWLRNGEQLLLIVGLPLLGLLFGIDRVHVLGITEDDFAVGVIGAAVFASAFTGQAILTAFDRRSGALVVLGSGPLGRSGLLLARSLLSFIIALAQCLLLVLVAIAMGVPAAALQRVAWNLLAVPVYVGMALAMAGTMRAERVLATANLVVVIATMFGGFFTAATGVATLLPTAAITALSGHALLPALSVLSAWGVAGWLIVLRRFNWTD